MAQSELNGFVKIDRGILDWEWYSDIYTSRLFIHCILKANWKDGSWKGQPYKRGQFITSLQSLANELGCSVQNIKTALKHLISTGELTSKATNKYRIITVCNYDKYQVDNRQDNKVLTINQQTTNKQLTTDEEYKEYKNIRNNNNMCAFAGANEGASGANKEETGKSKEKHQLKYATSFEEAWHHYPRHKDKALAYKAYNARLNDGYSEDELLIATKAYATECKKKDTPREYIKLAKTFYGTDTPFIDYLKAGEENAVQETEAERQQRLADEYNAKYANRY